MTTKNTIAFQLLRAVNQQEIELAEERAAHLATRQELSMALAQRHVLVEAAVRATIEACKQEVFDLPTYQVGDDETKCVMLALTDLDPAPIVARVLGGGE